MPLTVTAAARRMAILKLMAELGYLEAGARMKLTDLMAAWTRVGLRADDLSTGLNESLEDGILEFSAEAVDSAVWLTPAGKAWKPDPECRDADGRTAEQVLQAALQRSSASDAAPPFRDRRKS
ncbi:MAG: hypothetical protein ISP90_13370 [Nevskia sp.]|nr:hypothetical protein [Nevskia sp.]